MNKINFNTIPMAEGYNTIYKNLREAQLICAGCSHLETLFDLIQYNFKLLKDYKDLSTIEKQQIYNFSKEVLKASKSYKEVLKYSLI
jgi:hypothetical protein|tara:strand:+ start:284 stop:544 length:261 start_codon:yes stop_codon:yes gene_type:complete